MTEQEKELVNIMTGDEGWLIKAKAIIARFPQVLAEKCYEGEAIQLGLTSAYKDTVTQSALWGSTELTKIKVYIEVQS